VLNGFEAIELVKAENPRYDIIFMDHMMPEMDGVETMRKIRSDIGTEYARHVPIVILTANALVGNEEMFLENGFDFFIPKPIDMALMNEALNRWILNKEG
jgi:CheY-like chemotaxis protein